MGVRAVGVEVLSGAAPSDLGSGCGFGHGYGYGYSYGSGHGYGHGDGYGYGDGHGYGHGCGDGDGYWQAYLAQSATCPPGATLAFWKSDREGKPSNGGSQTVAGIGLVEELPGPLPESCGRGAFHATLNPQKWNGERLWIVAMHGEVRHGEDKLWGLKREFLAEVPWKP